MIISRRSLLQSAAAVTALAAGGASRAVAQAQNVLLQPWTGPLKSPPFDKVKTADFAPAFAQAFAAHSDEIRRIAQSKAAPTFGNTIAAMESSGKPLIRVSGLFDALSGTMADDAMKAVEKEVTPKIAAHSDEVNLQPGLYQRVLAVHRNAAGEKLTPEQKRVAEIFETNLVRAGAKLDAAGKARMTQINQRLAALETSFSQNMLADEEGYSLALATEADLAGLPAPLREEFAAHAKEKGKAGIMGLVANTRSSMEPFLTFSSRRDLREKGWRMWVSRGDNNDAHDNKKVIAEILALREERAKLLGYPTHAHFRLDNTMAKTPEAALSLIASVWARAVKAANADRDAFQAMAASEGATFAIEPWDWRYYAEKVRKAKYDVNEEEVKPYLQLSKMRDAAFWCAGRLFGVTFEQRTDVPVYHPDMTVWTVKDSGGAVIGLFYIDPFARAGKRSGAWMNEFRTQSTFEGKVLPLVVNCTNFSKPAPGEPALLSLDDTTTLFHELGHALHGLLTRTAYPSVAGTNVYRDFVEFPSQINEHWALLPQVLQKYAVHYKTGEPIPMNLVERIKAAENFNQGFSMGEYLASAYVDMDLHMAPAAGIDAAAFEKASLARLGMPKEIVMRHRLPHFSHIFSGGYSAGYYSYLWSQVLDNDGFEAFEETGDPFNPVVAKRYRQEVLERGNSRDPAESYRAFRGRDPKIDALLRNTGLG